MRRYLFILILISVLVSIPLLVKRVSVENTSKKVDFVLDYSQTEELAKQSGKPIEYWYKEFKKMGVGSVGIEFETIASMMQEREGIECDVLENIRKDESLKWEYPYDVVTYIDSKESGDYDMIVRFTDKDDFNFASKGLEAKYGKKIHSFEGSSSSYIIIKSGYNDMLYDTKVLYSVSEAPVESEKKPAGSKAILLPIGLDEAKIETAEKAGLKVLPRLENPEKGWLSKDYYKSMSEDYNSLKDKSPYMLFVGKEVFGNPKYLDDTIKLLRKNKASVGIVETVVERGYIDQKGLENLLNKLEYNVIKVYSIPDYIQKRYKYMNYEGAEEVGNVLFRAITERNANLIYFRPFINEDGSYVTKVKDYENMFKDLGNRLERHGISIGETKPYDINYVRKIAVIALGLGVVAAGVLVLNSLFNMKNKTMAILTAVGVVGMAGIVLVLGRTGYMILAIATAIVFPSLGITAYNSEMKRLYLYDRNIKLGNALKKGIMNFLFAAVITAIGSLIIAAIMSSTRNILDIDFFKGVKLTQMVPLLVYLISFIGMFGYKRVKKRGEDRFDSEDFSMLMNDTPKVFYFVVLGLIGIVGYVYLARTGHETNLQPSNLELMFRNMLERVFYARPRTKEFLIAFPALIVGATFAVNKFKPGMFIAGLAGVIGVTSIVNTFSHFKTPFLISLSRLGGSILLGIIVGAIYILIIYLLDLAIRKISR